MSVTQRFLVATAALRSRASGEEIIAGAILSQDPTRGDRIFQHPACLSDTTYISERFQAIRLLMLANVIVLWNV